MSTRFTAVDERLTSLKTRPQASNENALARIHNSRIGVGNQSLVPMVNVTDGRAITGLPATGAELKLLSGRNTEDVLLALEAPTEGHMVEKRKRLRLMLGLAGH
ncbi:MAG: hypothetical protein M1823_000085 [Watsoniomyces obsoletus]|nr:MAG: hypothetical protein M1823_000085 [Watsoniomyces obsoletus]